MGSRPLLILVFPLLALANAQAQGTMQSKSPGKVTARQPELSG